MSKRDDHSRHQADAAFRQVRRFEPVRVAQTRLARGDAAADRQATAIALDQARQAGARIPKKRS